MNGNGSPPLKRQRASRRGQPRKFECSHEGCEKRYSRAEHLARHRLNHSAKIIYRCDREGCGHEFVRPDLFARHKKKHEESTSDDQNAILSPMRTVDPSTGSVVEREISATQIGTAMADMNRTLPPFNINAAPSTSISLVANSIEPRWREAGNTQPDPMPSATTLPSITFPSIQQSDTRPSLPNFHAQFSQAETQQLGNVAVNGQPNDNFAAWLFDSPGSHNSGFEFNNMPFLDFGMDFAPADVWTFDDYTTGLTPAFNARAYSNASVASDYRPDREPHLYISEERRIAIIGLLSAFMGKKPLRGEILNEQSSILFGNHSDWPNLTVTVLESCVTAFWSGISSQIPIAHQPTFSANRCQLYLLLSIIALGAAAIVRSQPKGMQDDYRAFGDFLATNLRWEIFLHSDSEPPVHLWVAQTLIFLEFYEKMFSTRKLHERANIHHASTLTLLRRGSPMVGRTGSETPPSELPTRCMTPVPGYDQPESTHHSEAHMWWKRWVSNECMNRVVFAAFQMDTLHACMFGHTADLLPHELRLPLPCDDSLWTAKNGEEVRRLESTFAMYRIKPVNFLDGLKRCLHGYEVQTHRLGREILVAGLLSVGWHIQRREKNLQFVETVPSAQEQARWRSLLLQAFGHWRRSFDEIVRQNAYLNGLSGNVTTQDASDPTVLFHFAHLTMHVDIIDCQILTGTRRLLGRRVSDKDRASTAQRMKVWATSAPSRHAALHAFKLLQVTLCKNNSGAANTLQGLSCEPYSCRNDPFIYRPWILYLAGLTIWAYQYASNLQTSTAPSVLDFTEQDFLQRSACHYISTCAALDNAERIPNLVSKDGCIAVCQLLSQDFANAEAEILIEAAKKLQEGVKKLFEAE